MKTFEVKLWVKPRKDAKNKIITREVKAHTKKSARLSIKKYYQNVHDFYSTGIIEIKEKENEQR